MKLKRGSSAKLTRDKESREIHQPDFVLHIGYHSLLFLVSIKPKLF
jgi:hypothetical protein